MKKRLIATSFATSNFGIDTEQELKKLHSRAPQFSINNLTTYEGANQQTTNAIDGHLYFNGGARGNFTLYCVEFFCFNDVELRENNRGEEIEEEYRQHKPVVGFVATLINDEGEVMEQYQHTGFQIGKTARDIKNMDTIVVNGKLTLQRLKSANNVEEARKELKENYTDFVKFGVENFA